MQVFRKTIVLLIGLPLAIQTMAQAPKMIAKAEGTMLKATKYMVEEVSTDGGYLWHYLPDFSRQWGEMEAYKTMIWLQNPGTISMGYVFLDAYHATGDEYYYQAAGKAANAIIWGQNTEGGWNYMIDFAGDRSLKEWYNTIGKNGWRLEEFQHYYDNATFDDDVTSDAARFLLRMYLGKLDPAYKPSLDKAIDFILESQYPNGGWPQRYPLKYDFNKQDHPDYTSFYTFNDDVIWENVHFLIQCYLTLGQERFLDPIHRGMNFYLISQDGCGAWGQQLDLTMQTAGARTYEPAAFLPSTTFTNAMLLLRFYQYTGDRKFLSRVPDAIKWLEENRLPAEQSGGKSHPTFIDVKTGRPIYVHRKGSNVTYGTYYVDENDDGLLSHYGGKTTIPIDRLKNEYERISRLSVEEATKDSPLKTGKFTAEGTPQTFYDLHRSGYPAPASEAKVIDVINSLDATNRWLIKHASTSHPYIGDGQQQSEKTEFASTHVGDETDTSPYRDTSDQLYVSTGEYIRNMKTLIRYVRQAQQSPLPSLGTVLPDAKPIAFPGAEGFGRYTTGGRGGDVYHVTTLEDGMQPGTLRYALSQQAPRTVVFDVAGTIFLDAPLRITNGDLTLAGQTAPGEGICIARYPVSIGADNVIIRYLRFRVGNEGKGEPDGLGGTDQRNIIVDHCSISWSVDEASTVYGNENTTVQWCIVSESLRTAGHAKGKHGYGAIVGGARASFHHNLLAHHESRTPRLGPRPATQTREWVDMRNNVIYNWAGAGCYGGEGMQVNIVNNYYKPGPATPKEGAVAYRIAAIGVRTSDYVHNAEGRPNVWAPMEHVWGKFYVDGNVVEGRPDVTNDNWTKGIYGQINNAANDHTFTEDVKRSMRLDKPLFADSVTTHSAEDAYHLVLQYAGCSKARDIIDKRIVHETASGTARYHGSVSEDAEKYPGLIDTPYDVLPEGATSPWPALSDRGISANELRDSDGDGIPDLWETAHGLNPHDVEDGNATTVSNTYYTNLEVYMNSLTLPLKGSS